MKIRTKKEQTFLGGVRHLKRNPHLLALLGISFIQFSNGAVMIDLFENLDGTWNLTTTGSLDNSVLIDDSSDLDIGGSPVVSDINNIRTAIDGSITISPASTVWEYDSIFGPATVDTSIFLDGSVGYPLGPPTPVFFINWTGLPDLTATQNSSNMPESTYFSSTPVSGTAVITYSSSGPGNTSDTVTLTVTTSTIPEPSTLLLSSLGALSWINRRKKPGIAK